MEIDKIKLHPIEMCNEMACCIAYCIGATSENVEEIANQISEDMVFECVDMIRDKVKNNKMNNKAICRKTDEHFTEGKEYECTAAYATYESAVVDILDNNKELVTVEINDENFQFIFN